VTYERADLALWLAGGTIAEDRVHDGVGRRKRVDQLPVWHVVDRLRVVEVRC
jgi:hypothetical protein